MGSVVVAGGQTRTANAKQSISQTSAINLEVGDRHPQPTPVVESYGDSVPESMKTAEPKIKSKLIL
jgi:hypothetical protein